jgi:hypothetical protein
LSEAAIKEINTILSAGKGVEIAVRNGRLIIWETNSKKKHDVVVTPR